MRKIFMLLMTLALLAFSAAASAAQVTDAKWGLSKDNVLRFVVDVTDTAGYSVELSGSTLQLKVNAALAGNVPRQRAIKSTLASTMSVMSAGSSTIIKVPLKKNISSSDCKAFVLKKDPVTKRPFRVVLDVTADERAGSVTLVGSKPVISNQPVKNGSSAKNNGSVTVSSKPSVSSSSSDKDKDSKNEKNSKTSKKTEKKKKNEVVKGSGKFKTGGGIKGKVITLDAGHGGTDPGAVGKNGTKEKTITLSITKKVQAMLEKKGAKVYMTRTTDVDVFGPYAGDAEELQARVNVAEKRDSDLFISLHINSSVNKNVGGFTSYYYPKTSNDMRIAKAIQKQLTDNFGVDDLGVREANFYVIKRCSMPATLLELCFISNPKEEKLMKSNWFQEKAARLIVSGIAEYFD